MKYVVVLCDGMADEPLEELGGMTPLEKAHTPNLDRMAQISEIGMVQTAVSYTHLQTEMKTVQMTTVTEKQTTW